MDSTLKWILTIVVGATISLASFAYNTVTAQIDTLNAEVQKLKTDTALQQAVNERVLEQLERIEKKVDVNTDRTESERIDEEVKARMKAILEQLEEEARDR